MLPPIKPLRALSSLLILGMTLTSSPGDEVQSLSKTIVDRKALTFAAGPATRFGISVNGRSHQQWPLVSYRGYQYVTYFNASRQVCIGRRKLPNGLWDVIAFDDHRFETNDSHNTAVLGICDKDGTIHMAFDHHASQLNYRVSQIGAAHNPKTTEWTKKLFGEKQHSLGKVPAAERVTYPRFFAAPNGNLMLYYRSVTSANGDGFIEEYDGGSHQWTPGLGKFISRDKGILKSNGQTSHNRCPYMNCLSYAGNRLHASWVWRDRFEKTLALNNHSLCYAYSDDHGRTWHNSAGKMIGSTGKAPIHLDTEGLVVAPIPLASGLSNQTTHYAFPDGSIHIVVFHRAEGSRERRYQHYWRTSAGRWHHQALPFGGNRPKLLATPQREMILIFSDNDTLQLAKGTPNAQITKWKWERLNLPEKQSIAADAIPDPTRWATEEVLSLYLQEYPKRRIRTKKPEAVDGVPSPLIIMDYRVN
ncbi:BNR repeat-containing protein [Roseibacillus persicicus]|uniref:BNR repeat-containing protein n=1 Tax=Roseibacillus persicicus TaxID=454148 RepID=UPI00398B4870